tara:strand:+ start:1301 stop:1993 length:693 start_codon:yes stop_codon:yes gene_type:complete
MKIFTYIKNDSSRVSKKNFRTLGASPLWKHLVYEMNEIPSTTLYIDTDSNSVLQDCRADKRLSDVIAYKRKKRFIDLENDPNNKISPALLMTQNFLEKHVSDENEVIVLTHVTSPFLKSSTVVDAASYLNKGYDSVHSTYSVQDFAWLGEKYAPINFNPAVVQKTQDIEKIHFSSGAFFIFTKRTFLENMNRLGKNVHYYGLDKKQAIEIDTLEDLEFARVVHRGIKNER